MLDAPIIDTNNYGEKFILFYGLNNPNSICSNWYKAEFTIEDITFSCVEQYMMYMKAILFGDTYRAKMILNETVPLEMKRLGRQVDGFVDSVWNDVRYGVVLLGVYNKFNQNSDLKEWLLSVDVDYFVECNPRDRIWGIGMSRENDNAVYAQNWRGRNLLGSIIKTVQNKLKED